MASITRSLAALNAVCQQITDLLGPGASSGVPVAGACFNLTSVSFSGTVTFQASTDGTNFFPVAAFQLLSSGLWGNPTSTATGSGQFYVPVVGYTAVQAIATSYSSGSMTVVADVSGAGTMGQVFSDVEGLKASYSAATTAFTPVATPTDFWQLLGSATKTVRLTYLRLVGVSTAASVVDTFLIKRTAASTGGTPTALTNVAHDSNDSAATAVVNTFAANPSPLGTSAGNMRARKLFQGATPAGTDGGLIWDFTQRQARAPVLRGVAQSLNLNWGGVAVPAGTVLDIECEWTEE